MILIVDCGEGDQFNRGTTHLSNANGCGYIHGMMYEGNNTLEDQIEKGIEEIVHTGAGLDVYGDRKQNFIYHICKFVTDCHTNFTDFGTFYKNPYMYDEKI